MPGAKTGVARLVFCDRHDASWVRDAVAYGSPEDTWDLLLVGVSVAAYRRRFADELARLPHLHFVETGPLAATVQSEVSEYVLDLVARLPSMPLDGAPIGERLARPDGNLWWSLEITEKSPFRGALIERLFRLGLLDRVLSRTRYTDLWVRLSDQQLADVVARGVSNTTPAPVESAPRQARQRLLAVFPLAYWVRAVRAAVNVALIRLVLRLSGARGTFTPGELALFTMYPYWWLSPYDGRAVDRFFSAPPSRAHGYVAWLTSPVSLWRHRAAVSRQLRARRILPLQSLLSARDVVAILDPRRYVALATVHSRLDRLQARFLRFDVSALVAEELRQSLGDAELFLDQLLFGAIRELSRRYRPAAVVYRAEGQPWESALVRAAGAEKSIGFFHSPFGRNYPALRFAAGEMSDPAGPAGRRPLPGGALVCGEITRRYMIEDGYPSVRITRCGPQRHARFMAFLETPRDAVELRRKSGLPVDATVYFVSLAIVEVETEGLFACLEEALRGRTDVHLVIKTHPNRPTGDSAMRAAVESIGRKHVTILQPADDMYEYLAASDAMITIGSTVAFEALALGVMPVVYEHPATYAATSLRAFDSSLFIVDSPESMRSALEAVDARAPEAASRRAEWPEALRQVFGDMGTPLATQMDAALAQLGV